MLSDLQSDRQVNHYSNLEQIAGSFDGVLLDAYGVFWGGSGVAVLPGSQQTMEKLVAQGKIVGILSNATQLAEKEIEKLKAHGLLQGVHYHFLITSGTVARGLLANDGLTFATLNKKFLLFGEPHPKYSSHPAIFGGSAFQETTDLGQADFVFISVPHKEGKDQTDPEVFREDVAKFKGMSIPMLCINPDRFAHEGSPPQAVVRQGSIAQMHEQQGGQVFYVGKPSNKMFIAAMHAFKEFGLVDPAHIVMVGDTPETDIRGAKSFGMKSALVVKTGIMADRIARDGAEKAFGDLPESDIADFYIETMGNRDV